MFDVKYPLTSKNSFSILFLLKAMLYQNLYLAPYP